MVHPAHRMPWAVRLLIPAALAALAVAGCDRREERAERAPSPSAVVVGQAPQAASGDTAQTAPASPNTSDLTKRQEQHVLPREGDNHSYSTVAPNSPQKAQGVDPQQLPERK